jgi:hypothetical protein
MPKYLGEIATTTSENEEIAAVRIAIESLLNLQGKALHATPHVRVARRDPDPTPRRNRNHVRSAFNVAAINTEDAFAPIRIRASFISTKIAPASGSPADITFAVGG